MKIFGYIKEFSNDVFIKLKQEYISFAGEIVT